MLKPCKLFLALALLSASQTAFAQTSPSGQLRMTQQEIIAAKSTGPKAPVFSNLATVQVIVIHGDPSQKGLYTILLKVARHTKIPAHHHPNERIGTVVSRTWYFGYGDQFDENKLKELPVGSIYSEVENQNHFAMTKDEPVIAEITGYGPSGTTYINPSNDPAKKNEAR